MAWTVNETSEDRAERTRDARNQSRFFQIIADNDSETPQSALLATGLPVLNDVHPSDGFSVCDRVSITREKDHKRVFNAEVVYTTAPGPGTPGGTDDPYAQPTEEEWFALYEQREIIWDFDGRAIQTSSQELYEGVSVTDITQVVRFTRNEASYSAQWAGQFLNKMNADSFHGSPPGSARVHDITARKLPYVQNGVVNYYWRITIEIHFRQNIEFPPNHPRQPGLLIRGWDLRLADAGLYRTDLGERERILDDQGRPIVSPMPLNGAGAPILGGAVGDVFWNVFTVHASINFSLLGL